MTNAEKYLKDGVENIESLIQSYFHFIGCVEDSNRYNSIYQFFLNEAKPQLTEDERVILKNLKSIHNVIGRNREGNIQLMCKEPKVKDCIWHINLSCYNHLFQFIKERRKIQNRGVVERRRKQ